MLPSPGTTLIKVRWLGLENLNGRYVEPERTIDVAGQSTHRDGFLGFQVRELVGASSLFSITRYRYSLSILCQPTVNASGMCCLNLHKLRFQSPPHHCNIILHILQRGFHV